MPKIIRFFVILVAFAISCAVILGFLGRFHPALDTFSHFRLHLSVGLLFAAIVLLLSRRWRLAIATLLIGFAGVYSALPGTVFTARNLPPENNSPVYSLFHFNLLLNNPEKTKVLNAIRKHDPELITVVEQSPKWRERFAEIMDVWPHHYECRKAGQWNATSLYSKWPITRGSEFCGYYASMAKVDLKTPEGISLAFVTTHLRWPWPASGPKQLEILAPDIQKLGPDAIVSGDFNAVTWSWAMRRFANLGGLSIVPGTGPTWMADEPIVRDWFWAGLPIDNILEKGRVRVLSTNTLEDMGSDHLPVLVRFQLSE